MHWRVGQSVFLLICLIAFLPHCRFVASQDASMKLVWEGDQYLVIVDLPKEETLSPSDSLYQELFRIYVGLPPATISDAKPQVLGRYQRTAKGLSFQPLFPFQADLSYTAVYKQQRYVFQIPQSHSIIPTRIQAVYPSAIQLPSNTLKFYLYSSAPMSEGSAYQHIHLINEQGDTLHPFLPLYPELWDSSRQRLTLWFDPGRIKRALGPNEDRGALLQLDKQYRVVISSAWKDRKGVPLKEDFHQLFTVMAADRVLPKVEQWTIHPPTADSPSPLKIDFGESLDQVLAQQAFTVFDSRGEHIMGREVLEEEERRWVFYAEQPWLEGRYRIRVAAWLEDLAGNNLNRLFDRDLEQKEEKVGEESFYWLEFEIGAAE